MARRGRGRRGRDEYVVEEVYYDDEPGIPLRSIIIGIIVLMVIGGIAFAMLGRRRVAPPFQDAPGRALTASPKQQEPELKPVEIGTPKINLKAVEDALWKTKTDNPKDFKGWMQKFEDEANAIYFATLKKAQPNADPTTLMKKPLRVDPQRKDNLLHIYGYIDNNNQPGYQNEQDNLLFAFQQSQPYDKASQKLNYSLRDGSGYYYREPTYSHPIATGYSPFLLGFFLYPTIWYGPYYRTSFGWWGTPYWRSGFFYGRYNHYYASPFYGGYYGYYRSTYYSHHRPWGWGRGSYYRRNSSGRYYSRGSRYGGSRYRSGSRYRGNTGSRYRGGSRSGSRYRGGSNTGSRYRGGSNTGSRYRGGSSSGSRYRGGSRGGSRGGGKW